MRRAALFLVVWCSGLGCGGRVDNSPTATTTAGTPSPVPREPTTSTASIVSVSGYEGGLTHLFIYATDTSSDLCLTIQLTYPGTGKTLDGIATPKEWGVASAIRSRGTDHCGPGQEPPTAETAIDGVGGIEFSSTDGALPCSLSSAQVSLTFRSHPQTEILAGENVAVQGCQ